MARLVLPAVLLAALLAGCDREAADKDAYERGASAGLQQGYRDGLLDGAGTPPGEVREKPDGPNALHLAGSVLLGVLLGFGGQYFLFYLLRTRKVISDVDGMLLEGGDRPVPLDEPPDPGIKLVLLLALLPAILSCGVEPDEYQRGYRVGYAEGYATGYAEGTSKRGAGAVRGVRAGEPEPLSTLHLPALLVSLLASAGFGVALQYSILSDARRKRALPSLAACAFVPGMRSSFAFRLLAEKTRAMAELDEFLRRVREEKRARIAEIEAVREGVEAKIRAASSLEALFAEKVVDLARREFERIVEGR